MQSGVEEEPWAGVELAGLGVLVVFGVFLFVVVTLPCSSLYPCKCMDVMRFLPALLPIPLLPPVLDSSGNPVSSIP